jgi:hypothetical protein
VGLEPKFDFSSARSTLVRDRPRLTYSILSNISFTSGYLLPEALPVYYLPKELLIEYLLAFGLAFGANLFVLPVTSRQIFLVWLAFPPADLGVLFFLFVGDI